MPRMFRLVGRWQHRIAATPLVVAGFLIHGPPAASAAVPLNTAIVAPATFSSGGRELAFSRTRNAGANFVEVAAIWSAIAPKGNQAPPGFNPSNPIDPHYNWGELDTEVRGARRHGLEISMLVAGSPPWAQEDPSIPNYNPDPQRLAAFAHAAARRYSGSFAGLPRVRYWLVWNEPNLNLSLKPQLSGNRMVSADRYRAMVNAFANAVKSVKRSNRVVAGQLAPFAVRYKGALGVSPVRFIRKLLASPVRFDIWSYHPYTVGQPSDPAHVPGDVSLGDLRRVNKILRQARRAGKIRSAGPVQFWVSEFTYDSKPPSRGGVPVKLLTRWVAELLYQLWRADVSVATWYMLRDGPRPPSGLYFNGGNIERDRPKPSLAAFRFPFVAYASRAGIRVWGRTPFGRRGTVVVEQLAGRWMQVRKLRTGRYGIFVATVGGHGHGPLRARLEGRRTHSPAFSLTRPPDLLVQPFG